MNVYDNLWITWFPKSETREGSYKHEYAKRLAERYREHRDAYTTEKAEFFLECAAEDRDEYADGIQEGQPEEDMIPCLWEAEVKEKLAENLDGCLRDEYENRAAYRRLAGW